jgi:hypothetical protein
MYDTFFKYFSVKMKHIFKLTPTLLVVPIYYFLVATIQPEKSISTLMFISACGVISLFDFGNSIKPNFVKCPVLPGVNSVFKISALQLLLIGAIKADFFIINMRLFNEFNFWEILIYTTLMSVTNHARIAIDLNHASSLALSFIRGGAGIFRLMPAILFINYWPLPSGIWIFIFFEATYICICYVYDRTYPGRPKFEYSASGLDIRVHWTINIMVSLIDLFLRGNLSNDSAAHKFFIYDIVSRMMVLINLFSSLSIRLIQTHTKDFEQTRRKLNNIAFSAIFLFCVFPAFGASMEFMFMLCLAVTSIQSVLELGHGSILKVIFSKMLIVFFFLTQLLVFDS